MIAASQGFMVWREHQFKKLRYVVVGANIDLRENIFDDLFPKCAVYVIQNAANSQYFVSYRNSFSPTLIFSLL